MYDNASNFDTHSVVLLLLCDLGDLIVAISWLEPTSDNHKPQKKRDTLDKFALHSGEQVSFSLSSRQLRVTVSDTGAGMSEDQVAQLYRDGVQFNVNQLQAGHGSGLGLFITKGIVEQHGGTLAAASQGVDRGTTFTITLPLYNVPDSELPPNLKHLQLSKSTMVPLVSGSCRPAELRSGGLVPPGSNGNNGKSLRILVVDDVFTNRKLLIRLLQIRGHYCDEAKDGQEAVDKVVEILKGKDEAFDTILLDYEMPVMDGPTAAKKIRALGSDSCIVGITGNVLPEVVAFFKQCGANFVCPKPVKMEALEGIWAEFGIHGKGSSSANRGETTEDSTYSRDRDPWAQRSSLVPPRGAVNESELFGTSSEEPCSLFA
jgi:CheY-like chemotaxis protein